MNALETRDALIEKLETKFDAVQDELNKTFGSANNRATSMGRRAHNRKSYLYGKRKRLAQALEGEYEKIMEEIASGDFDAILEVG